jgi:protein SCO1/2
MSEGRAARTHEDAGIDARLVLLTALGLALALVVVMVSMTWVWRYGSGARAAPSPDALALPPVPRLQPHPRSDLARVQARETARLQGYAWLDDGHRHARIPVQRAAAIVLRRAQDDTGKPPSGGAFAAPRRATGTVTADPHREAATDAGAAHPCDDASTALRAPPDLRARVGFDQRLGALVPLDPVFRDATGRRVRLGGLFDGHPVLLILGYYGCPNLCGAVLDGVARSLGATGLHTGRDVEVIDVSIDPAETPALAALKQAAYAKRHPAAGIAHWHFLTGPAVSSRALADAVGFRYYRDPRNGQYAHAAGIVLLTPRGEVSRYLFGVAYAPRALRLGLVDASGGRIGSLVDRLLLLCCAYDASTGRYSLLIGRLLAAACVATLLLLGLLLWRLERIAGARAGAAP